MVTCGLALQDNQLSSLSPCSTVLDDGFPKDKSRKTIILFNAQYL